VTYTIRNQRAEMRRLRQTGHLTLSEIGDRVGASKTAVRANLLAMGIATRRQKRQSSSL
jgi:hypothetical protein